MWNSKPKEQKYAEKEHTDRISERLHKIYNMPSDFKEQVLNFEKKFLTFNEQNPETNTHLVYLQQLGTIKNLDGANFTIIDREFYEEMQTLFDGLQELRCRRKFAEEKEMDALVEMSLETLI